MSILNVRKSSSCKILSIQYSASYADEKEEWYRESKEKEVLHLHVYGSIYGHSQVPLNLFVQSLARCQIFHRFQKLKSVQNEINNLIFFVDVYLFSTK